MRMISPKNVNVNAKVKVKGEEAPKGGLQRKINADSAESKRRRSSQGRLTAKSQR
jgi:hypothetical protein